MAAFRKSRTIPLSAPHCGFNAEEEQPFLALPHGNALLNGRYMTGKVLGRGRVRHHLSGAMT